MATVPRSIHDNVLFCETVTWQWENLGDGSRKEFRRNACPLPRTPLGAAGEGGGDERKGRRGRFDVPEVWPIDPRCAAAFADVAAWEEQEERHERQLRALEHVLRAGDGAKRMIVQHARRATMTAQERLGAQHRLRKALRVIKRLKCDSFGMTALWADPDPDPGSESTTKIEM